MFGLFKKKQASQALRQIPPVLDGVANIAPSNTESLSIAAELASYFEEIKGAHLSDRHEISLNLLDRQAAVEFSKMMSPHPVLEAMGGVVLDDVETSNHHIFVTKGPLVRSIFFLSHDGDSRVVFDSLRSFLAAANDSRSRGIWFEELHPPITPTCTFPGALDTLVTSLLDADQEYLIPFLVPSMDLKNIKLLERLAVHADFFLGEAVAEAICLHPSEELRELAILCSRHPHRQVADAGKAALNVLDKNNQT